MSSYPDYGKAPKPYLLSITEALSHLSDDVVAAVLDLKTGVRAKCSYLPTIADIMTVADEYIKRRDQFRTFRSSAPEHRLLPPSKRPAHRAIEPHGARVYPEPEGGGLPDRISMPHKAKGKPWSVKPEGYWTRWTPEQRKAWDEREVSNVS